MTLLRQELPSSYIGTLSYLPRTNRMHQAVALVAVTSVASLAVAVRLGNAVVERIPRMPQPFSGSAA